MPIRVNFVSQIGRVSAGNLTMLPKVEAICAKYGGKVVGGAGSSQDPVVGEFAEAAGAKLAAQEAWLLDDVEFAKVVDLDKIGPGVTESVDEEQGETADPILEAIDAVADGAEVTQVVDGLLAPAK